MSKDDDVNHGSAASSRVMSRRNFLKVSVTGAAIASAGGLSFCTSRLTHQGFDHLQSHW
ncbi:twin-arginine translocation signal domain-containing protein [Mesorhizobium sp. M6A.T.Ce.TU.002.03.1.1]|nr:twin-arginine translocation signal domain-containing protein [Mesorhizobium sp. M6A.T.Ce.TU.002.03.1.1]RWN32679.1 MAG: twin-arginine translocation signal domain-containing protein [Mesorhizobium sp.]RWQ62604.1 MAG: twin-arginine translocation signal domain-containing protein [Mesorhizobium sp.]